MDAEPEPLLIDRAAAGDGVAFESLLRPLEPSMRRVIGGVIRGRGDLDVEEILQDARIYLSRRLDRYNPEYPFAVFARALARTIAKRHLYKKLDAAPAPLPQDEPDWPQELSPLELERLPLASRRLLGAGRFDDPEPELPSREFLDLFEVFLRHGGYPHQQAAFGYSILLWGKRPEESGRAARREGRAGAKVPITGDPARVVAEIGPEPLDDSCPEMVSLVREAHRLDPSYVARVARPLMDRLMLTLGALFSGDAASLKVHAASADRRAGALRLAEYFGVNPQNSVAEWTRAVKERIRRHYLSGFAPQNSPGRRV